LESKKTADSVFIVGGKHFQLHKCVLETQSPKLYEFAEMAKDKPFVIGPKIVDSETFDTVIRYIYGLRPPYFWNHEATTKAIFNAACYLQITNLKLHAEWYLAYEILNIDNASELLLLADSHACALLKEEAMKCCLMNIESAKKSSGWKLLQESPVLLEELLTFSCIQSRDKIDCMDVGELRKELQKRQLEVDGSREILVNRLRAACDKD
jgi:hypothetical protein